MYRLHYHFHALPRRRFIPAPYIHQPHVWAGTLRQMGLAAAPLTKPSLSTAHPASPHTAILMSLRRRVCHGQQVRTLTYAEVHEDELKNLHVRYRMTATSPIYLSVTYDEE